MSMLIRSNKIPSRFIAITFISLLMSACVEPFEPSVSFFERILVIDATLTDEIKNQELLLSGTYEFDEYVPLPEEGATVTIIDDSQTTYPFQEVSPGKYVSISPFGAQQGVSYQLSITTADGKKYASNPTQTPPSEPNFDIKPIRTLNGQGEDGMSIKIVYPQSNEQKYFRYEYEEMYKIVAPKYTDVGLRWVSPTEAIMIPKGPGGRICYKSEVSNTIIFDSPQGTENGELLEYPIHFVNSDNYILSHRYGIRIKQYAITRAAHSYLETLTQISGEDNIFSQIQPGFFSGNVYSEDNSDENVLGYFDVTTVTTKSVFFNYSDFYPDEPLPEYIDACSVVFYPDPAELRDVLGKGEVIYYLTNNLGEHAVVNKVCGDCREIGEPDIPEFWIE